MSNGGKGGASPAGGNVFQQAATAFNAAGAGTASAYSDFDNMGGYKPALFGDAAGYNAAKVNAPDRIASGLDRYMNPYIDQVTDSATDEIERTRLMQQRDNGDAALAAGAFGGGRHGIVESLTNSEAQRNTGTVAGNLNMQGFDRAAALSAQDIANRTGVQTFNKSAENQQRVYNAGADNAQMAADMAARNRSREFNLGQEAISANGKLAAARQGGELGSEGYRIGTDINANNAQYGGMQQGLMQLLMDGAQGMFGGFAGQGKDLLSLINSTIMGSPLNNESTRTESYTPGLFDYLSLGAQTAGSVYRPGG